MLSIETNETKKGMGIHARRILAYVVLILVSFLCLFWFYVLFVNATRSHGELTKGFTPIPSTYLLKNWQGVMAGTLPIVRGMFNSLFVASCSAVLCTYFSTMTAYAIHVYDFKIKKFMFTFIMAVMMIPTQVTALGFLQLVSDMKLEDNFIPLIVPAIAAPVTFFYMKQYMESALPLSLVEAARIDGATRGQYFWKIALPLLIPSIKSAAILSMVGSLKYFDLIYVMTGGGPGTATELMATYMYKESFKNFNMGYGSAIAGGMFILITMVSMITMKLINGKQED